MPSKIVCPHCGGGHFFRSVETLVTLNKRDSGFLVSSETPAISTSYECATCGKHKLVQKEFDPIEQRELKTKNKFIIQEVIA